MRIFREMVGSRVYVGGLPYGVRERDLERFFKGYGRTRDILIKNGYGFVVSVLCALLSAGYCADKIALSHTAIASIHFYRNLKIIATPTMPFTS